MASKVRIFCRLMIANVGKMVKVMKVYVALHFFFLMKTNNANRNRYFPVNYVETDGP